MPVVLLLREGLLAGVGEVQSFEMEVVFMLAVSGKGATKKEGSFKPFLTWVDLRN